MSTDFLKKINNRQLLIISTEFVNMGGCRSAPPYHEKKDKTRSLFFRVLKFEKKKIKFSHRILKKAVSVRFAHGYRVKGCATHTDL